jgi:hypothetical protein
MWFPMVTTDGTETPAAEGRSQSNWAPYTLSSYRSAILDMSQRATTFKTCVHTNCFSKLSMIWKSAHYKCITSIYPRSLSISSNTVATFKAYVLHTHRRACLFPHLVLPRVTLNYLIRDLHNDARPLYAQRISKNIPTLMS